MQEEKKGAYNVILLSVSLSWAIDLLSARPLSILSSQLISKPFVRLCMQAVRESSHEGVGEMWRRQKGKKKEREKIKVSERERDKLISDLKWQFDLAFCQENAILMKECINKGCREDVSQLQESRRDREGESGEEIQRGRLNRLDTSG